MSKEIILDKYDQKLGLYNDLARSMNSLITVLLSYSSINPNSVSFRVKERSSLAKKLEKKDKYDLLEQITDIVGLRIISNYSDEVDEIAKIIENEFCLDKENSIDKRDGLDPDRFGYLSLHYVVSLNNDRAKLAEYKRFKGTKFEIQIRSVLQHTWAEIEHDIGYKTSVEVPKPIRRKFSRLAGLLELADDQFIQIRDDLDRYKKTVQESIISEPESISVDAVSVYEFANTSQLVKNLDTQISAITNLTIKEIEKKDVTGLIKYLQFFGIKSISQLNEALEANSDLILRRAKDVNSKGGTAIKGLCIFYLSHALAAKTRNKEEIEAYVNVMGLLPSKAGEEFADYLLNLGQDFV
ncbi:MAG: hypothetical protein M0Q44_22280 [Methylobacter sp.]|nr:hypothetical protein [Methylobacter sp.]